MAEFSRSDIEGHAIGSSASAVQSGSGNGFVDWLHRLGNDFASRTTASTNDYLRGSYNAQQLLQGNPDPVNQTLSEIANNGDIGSNGGSLDITGTDQAAWDLEKTKELLNEQRAYNSAEAAKNREWQEYMSNTAYQRAVQDLEKAGLNKWLAVTGGNGASASTPSGSSATSSAGDAATPNPKIYEALLKFISSMTSSALKGMSILGHIG